MGGNIYRAQVYNGINGTLAFDFNAQNYTTGSTLLDASANAATITINGGATIVTAPALYFDGTNDYLKAPPFALSQPETVQFVGSQLTWTSGDSFFDGNASNGGSVFQGTGSPTVRLFAGSPATSIITFALKTRGLLASVFSGAASLLRYNKSESSSGNPGAANLGGFTLGSDAGGATEWANTTTNEVAVYSTAQTTAQLNQFATYAASKWRF